LSLSDNMGLSMHIAKDGTLWIGGSLSGLSKYNSKTETFTRYNYNPENPYSLSDNTIVSFSEDEKSNLWILTGNNGFNYMLVNEEKFIHMTDMLPHDYKIAGDRLTFIHQDSQNHLWIGDEGNIHYFKINYNETGHPKLQPVKIDNQLIKTAALSVEETDDGTIWIGTGGEGLLYLDRAKNVLTKFEVNGDNKALSFLAILAIKADELGNLWLGGILFDESFNRNITELSGLFRINIQSAEIQEFLADPKDPKGLSSNFILTLLIDDTGVLWIGTDISGLNVYDKSVVKFNLVSIGPEEHNEIKGPVRGFYLDEDQILWIASQGGGLVAYDREKGKYESYNYNKNNPRSISTDFVHS